MLAIQIIESFGGGTYEVVKMLTQFLHSNGHETIVFHGERAETPPDFRARFPAATEFIRLKGARAINLLADLGDAGQIARVATDRRASIIHGHSSKGGALARLAGFLTGVPVLYSPHGFSFLTEKGAKISRPTFWIEYALARLPGIIVCCSPSERDVARKLSRKIALVPNAIDIDALRAALAASPPRPIDVVNIGRLSAQKDPAKFMAVANALPDRRFLWIGGPATAVEGPLPANVEVTGWLSREVVLQRMTEAKVFLTTSRYEGMPLAILEAQALELTVVSTPVIGSRDLVEDGVTGRLASEAEQLAACVGELLRDDVERRRLAEAALLRLRRLHDQSTFLQRWESLYREHARRASGHPAGQPLAVQATDA